MLDRSLKSRLFRTIGGLTVAGIVLVGVATTAFALSSPQVVRMRCFFSRLLPGPRSCG